MGMEDTVAMEAARMVLKEVLHQTQFHAGLPLETSTCQCTNNNQLKWSDWDGMLTLPDPQGGLRVNNSGSQGLITWYPPILRVLCVFPALVCPSSNLVEGSGLKT